VMQELGLVGLRIQRMPNESDLEFGIPSQYSYMTVNFQYTFAYPYFTLECL
ncbi:4-alpha-glucanotransferase, partial [Trifolium medium]|nr:4-alpha-glucanotransferase [Trifolium medium]